MNVKLQDANCVKHSFWSIKLHPLQSQEQTDTERVFRVRHGWSLQISHTLAHGKPLALQNIMKTRLICHHTNLIYHHTKASLYTQFHKWLLVSLQTYLHTYIQQPRTTVATESKFDYTMTKYWLHLNLPHPMWLLHEGEPGFRIETQTKWPELWFKLATLCTIVIIADKFNESRLNVWSYFVIAWMQVEFGINTTHIVENLAK